MSTTSKISTTEGTGKNIATFSITEDAVTKELQRNVLIDSTGAEKGTSGNPVITSSSNGTAVKAEDSASASGDNGDFILGIRRGSGALSSSPTSTSGDYQEFAQDDYGQVRVAFQAKTANPSAASDGNGVVPITDKLGKQVVVGSIRDLKTNSVTTLTASTSETTALSAAGSGVFLDIYGVIVTNSSATATNIAFKDATGGSTRFNIYVPAGDTRGFMLSESGAYPQTTSNNNWTVTSSASVSSVTVTIFAVKNI